MHTIYGGKTLNEIEVENMVNLSFEAECTRQGCEAVQMINKKELEKEIEVWLSIYMEFNDYNRNHAELAFISNHLNIINDYQTMHAENLSFLKETAAHVNDTAPYPKLRKVSNKFDAYLDELGKELNTSV